MDDLSKIISLEMLEEKCLGEESSCSFSHEGYGVLAHRCDVRRLWEVHVYETNRYLTMFTIECVSEVEILE